MAKRAHSWLSQHPDFEFVLPHIYVELVRKDSEWGRKRIELRGAPPAIRQIALDMMMPCPACGRPYHPFRARMAKAKRGQPPKPSGSPYFRGACDGGAATGLQGGCSKGPEASEEYELLVNEQRAYRAKQHLNGLRRVQ